MNKDTAFQEKSFQAHIEVEKIKISRTMCLLGSLLYIIFGVVDFFSLSSTLSEVLFIRGGVIVVVMLCYASTFQKFFIKYYDFILSIAYLAAALGIESMIYLALPEDHASKIYFAGLILVIMIVFAWSYFRLATSIFVMSTIIGSYLYVELIKDKDLTESLVNVFFLLSAACIGFISQVIRDGFVRKNFLLQQALKEALKEKEKEAKGNAYLANHDALTGLPNRRYMVELLNESLEVAKSTDKILIIMFFDLNGFKQVNDIYGHAAGDEVLNIVSKRMELAIRKGDHIARLGGDEFLLGLLMDKDSLDEVDKIKEKFNHIISQPMKIDGQKIITGTSIGIAAYPIHGNNVKVLIDIADKKMYKAKHSSRTGLEEGPIDKGLGKEPVVIFPGYSKRQ